MKTKFIILLTALACITSDVCAQMQTRNLFFGDIVYNHKKKVKSGSLFKNVLGAASVAAGMATGTKSKASFSTTKECPEDADEVKASIKEGATRHPRFKVYDGDDAEAHKAEGGVVLSSDIKTIYRETAIGTKVYNIENKAKVKFVVSLHDAATGEKLDSRELQSLAYSGKHESNAQGAEQRAINDGVARATWLYLMEVFPVGVEVLDKGAEKENGKLSSIYIAMGSDQGAQKDWELYVVKESEMVERGKQPSIGRIRISEVQGENISLCRVKNGADAIQEAIDKGEKLVAVTNAGQTFASY